MCGTAVQRAPLSWTCVVHDGQGPVVDEKEDRTEAGGNSAAVEEGGCGLAEPDGCGISTTPWTEILKDDNNNCGRFGCQWAVEGGRIGERRACTTGSPVG
jgi:hypothetical protein